jgi:hypothetical protein
VYTSGVCQSSPRKFKCSSARSAATNGRQKMASSRCVVRNAKPLIGTRRSEMMMRINLLPSATLPASDKAGDQVLCKTQRSHSVTNPVSPLARFPFEVQPSSLPEPLLERLLGKSPLRLVTERTPFSKAVWLEKLECGHEVYAFLEFLWDEKAHLVKFEPNAKRRRCRECKALAEALPSPRKPPQSVNPEVPEAGAA